MWDVRYELIENQVSNEDSEKCVMYGIRCTEPDLCIRDITGNNGSLHRLIEYMNLLKLSPEHLHDVVIDFLGIEYGV